MPELPEVQTTVNGLRHRIIGLKITTVWSDYGGNYFKNSENIKNPRYFKCFQKAVTGQRVSSVERRAKNILINLEGGLTILVHLKMTGHLLYGRYRFRPKIERDPWEPLSPESLKDSYNRHVHLVFNFDNGDNLALSDVRTFAKVVFAETKSIKDSVHLGYLGPEPLDRSFTLEKFSARLDRRPKGRIKQVLMDQNILAGIGNIYADESLWRSGIHPQELVKDIPRTARRNLFLAIKKTLSRGLNFGGDSTSDYRNVEGEKGAFQENHHAYQQTGSKCHRPGCEGVVRRIVLGGRSTHFCDQHQRLQNKLRKTESKA